MKRKIFSILFALVLAVSLVLLTVPLSASANDPVTVLGTACPFFAGQTQSDLQTNYPPTAPPGSHANFHNDTASTAMMSPFIEVCGGGTLSITASGTWGYGPGVAHGPGGASGYPVTFWSHEEYDNLGISRVQGYPGNLVGVFLGDGPPSTTAPSALSVPNGDDMTTPLLQQAFIIGASLSDIQIPAGATRLFFGYFDGYEWNNNVGSVEVTVTMICLDIEKELLAGPEQIEIYLPNPTQYIFEITYSNPDPTTPVRIIDTVPAEFEILTLTPSAGTATFFDTSKGRGNSANRIEWDLLVGTQTATLTVVIQTVASPGKGHKDGTVFKPTSCGTLPLNDGATAFEVDPDTGEIVRQEVVDPVTGEVTLVPVVIVGPSNALEVEAIAGAKPCEEG